MPSKVESPQRQHAPARAALTLLMLGSLCLAGCATVQQPAPAPAVVAAPPAPLPAPEPAPAEPAPAPVAETPAPAITPVLAYADRARNLQGAELIAEISRLNDAQQPGDQLRLAVVLVQTRQLYDLVRAQELLQRVLTNTSPDAQRLHGLARLLAARLAEQRRVEDLLDRQGQQLRDAQRRLSETNEKLEALKEIERSLTRRITVLPVPAATRPNGTATSPAP
ncbi:MAG: hypothetical protein Q7T87_02465 [Polaromonas sp.]|nr:hypothetical protein [Polaromonas sp.]